MLWGGLGLGEYEARQPVRIALSEAANRAGANSEMCESGAHA
jgi:hypothetical protein